MENSKKKSGGVEIPKRNRSLDLKSLYNPRVFEEGGSKEKVSEVGGSKKKVSVVGGSQKKVSEDGRKKKVSGIGGSKLKVSEIGGSKLKVSEDGGSKKKVSEDGGGKKKVFEVGGSKTKVSEDVGSKKKISEDGGSKKKVFEDGGSKKMVFEVGGSKTKVSGIGGSKRKVSEDGGSKKKVSEGNGVKDVQKKKRKQVCLSSFEPAAKKIRKDELNVVKIEPGTSPKSSGGREGLHGTSLDLVDKVKIFKVPRRPRGTVARRKRESDQLSRSLGNTDSGNPVGPIKVDVTKSEDEPGPSNRLVNLVATSAGSNCILNSKSAGKGNLSKSKAKHKGDSKSSSGLKSKRKAEDEEVKKSRNGKSNSVLGADKDENVVVNSEQKSSKKRRSNSRKKQDIVVSRDVSEASTKKTELAFGSSVSDSLFVGFPDDDEDDEENLEQNAARMLSSRFDPSCTGFSSKKRTSISQSANDVSFPVSTARDSLSQHADSSGGMASPTADDKNITLRPRDDKQKDVPRKRRHFYDIRPGEYDPHWVLNRRIKIFWPLDESWYHGLVNDYHPESEYHHVKYDDRDEEWVDLKEEKFKLLLLPSEVPGKSKSKKQKAKEKIAPPVKPAPESDDDSSTGYYLDSEPIGSWLARSTQRVSSKSSPKSSPTSLKKQGTLQADLPEVPSFSFEKTDNSLSNSNAYESYEVRDKPCAGFASAVDLVVDGGIGKPLHGTSNSSQDSKLMVYVRKKLNKKSSASEHAKACECVTPVTEEDNYVSVAAEKQLWTTDHKCQLRINVALVDSKQFRFRICLTPLHSPEFLSGKWDPSLIHDMLMHQHGTLVTTSPAVKLEILFIDTNHGLRFLLFEGCMKQALAFVFLVLVAFNNTDEQGNDKMQLPVTSVRCRLSSCQDMRKHHTFAYYSFSGLQSSKWLSLDAELLQHCLILKQLPVSECTYDNIKELVCGKSQHSKTRAGLEVSSFEVYGKNLLLQMGLVDKPGEALSSSAKSFYPNLHLQYLMRQHYAQFNLERQPGEENQENGKQSEPHYVSVERIASEHTSGAMGHLPSSGFSSAKQDLMTDIILTSNTAEKLGDLQNRAKTNLDGAGCENTLEVIAGSQQHLPIKEVHGRSVSSLMPLAPTISKFGRFGEIKVDIPSVDTVDVPVVGEGRMPRQNSNVARNTNGGLVHSPSLTGVRSSQKHGKSSSMASLLGDLSPGLHDGRANFVRSGFSNGPKRPRTQVQYTLPSTGYDSGSKPKMQNQRALPCKRIRRASLKKISDGSKSNQKKLDLVACSANILVTGGDKGWRENGAHIVLEAADHNEWKLAVKLVGVTKYSYKVKHILQPGSTNRFSHAMMWKGGKDWVLEFPDRSQWTLFKEMHEECYNRNIRAASVKNIPIPGVRLIEDHEDCGAELPFVRSSAMYFRQVQSDVEMAMDPTRILYDIDSDDEQLLANKEVSDEFLEKAMDMFEKVAYVRKQYHFTEAEIEELMSGIGSVEAGKVVHEYWRQKRERKGMPLIRHLQPPLWERYQQQLKEWEQTIARGNSGLSAGQEKGPVPDKPPMVAFCLRPRGLDVPNRGSKQRSHRRYPVSGHHHAAPGDMDGLMYGRRYNVQTLGDERLLYPYADVSPSVRASTRVFPPVDARFQLSSDASEWSRGKSHRNQPKRLGLQRTVGNKNAVQRWNMGLPELSAQRQDFLEGHQKQGVEQLTEKDLHEFRLRDASRAARHARNIAKLKREKAQRLLARADLSIHKAVAALMTAEALKSAHESSNVDK